MAKMNTTHQVIIGNASNMEQIKEQTVQLVVTSPPYPMIEMWDDIMINQNAKIGEALHDSNGSLAYELMHQELDKVWSEVNRILMPGGFACINIGDATRTINGEFGLYPSHSRIISAFLKLGLTNLPNIIWRKQTNAPNKFMGAGMLPAGAYVTLEHEWILIFRKGGKRVFKTEDEKLRRKESSFFWEERNNWFSDLWDLKGTKQKIDNSETRKRSAAYPFEIPYRLINMYSLKGDTIVDPFLGTGTSTISAICSERNSIGFEIDPKFLDIINENIINTPITGLNNYIENRITQHKQFLDERILDPKKDEIKHFNKSLNLPVMTSQETEIQFSYVAGINPINDNEITAIYSSVPPNEKVFNVKKDKKSEQIPMGL